MYHPRLKGTHYEMGYKYGSLLYKKGVRFEPIIKLTNQQYNFGIQSLSILKQQYPEIIDEIKGMSDGLQYSFNHFAAFLLNTGIQANDIGCTYFCINTGTETFFAGNHDMFSNLKKITESALYRPRDGYIFLSQGDALIGKEDGVNEHGLAVAMTYIAPKHIQPGLNFLFIVRYLLEKCATTAQCLEILSTITVSTSQNIVIADKSGDMAVVELCPTHMITRKPAAGENFIIATNNFIHPEMIPYDNCPDRNWYDSETRYSTVLNNLKEKDTHYSIDYIKQILSGKLGFTCQYNRKLNFDTLWSFITNLNTLKIYRAEGNPSKTKYKEDTRLTWALQKKALTSTIV